MLVIAVAVLASALLLTWLGGWWGAKVLVFLLLLGAFGLVGYLAGASFQYTGHPEYKDMFPYGGVAGMMVGMIAAWPVSRLPEMYWRRRARMLAQAETNRFMVRY